MKIRKYGLLSVKRSDGEWSIVECDKEAKSISIPVEIDGDPVTSIHYRAFAECTELEEVVFLDSEEYLAAGAFSLEIGDYAFDGCTSLRELILPGILSYVGRGAFYGCSALVSVDMPRCHVGPYAFFGCERLTEVSPLSSIGEGVFSHCKSLAVFPVADGATYIDEDAFYHCYGLVDITIPASVERIESLAFRSCYNLKRVTFEREDGWYATSRYKKGKFPIDLSSPEENAKALSQMDFDDGIRGWYRK